MKTIEEILQVDRPQNGQIIEFAEPVAQHKPDIPKLDDLNQAHPKVKNAVLTAREWFAERKARPGLSLVMLGPVGTGKTHIARSIQWTSRIVEGDTPTTPLHRFYMSSDLLVDVHLRLKQDDPIQPLFISDVAKYENGLLLKVPERQKKSIVVIDDLGSDVLLPYVKGEYQESERQAVIFSIVNYCYQKNISLVITSNLNHGELEAYVGKRSWSRLLEMAPKGYIVDMFGVDDYRVKKGGRG